MRLGRCVQRAVCVLVVRIAKGKQEKSAKKHKTQNATQKVRHNTDGSKTKGGGDRSRNEARETGKKKKSARISMYGSEMKHFGGAGQGGGDGACSDNVVVEVGTPF